MCVLCDDLIKAIDRYISMADDELEEELEEEGRVLPEESVETENDLEDGIAAILIAETAYFISKIRKQKNLFSLMSIFDKIKAGDSCNKEIAKFTSEQLKKFIPKLVVQYGIDVDDGIKLLSVSKRTTAWIDTWSQELGNLMKLNSHTEIEDILRKALENGDSIQTATRAILDSGIRDEYYKARRVAMTELFRAHNVAKQEAAMQTPCVIGKKWRHSGIGVPRPKHLKMDGQMVRKDEPFTMEGADGNKYYPQYPVDPCLPAGEVVNCHCTVDNVIDESIFSLPAEERQRLRDEAVAKLDDEWERSVDEKYRKMAGLSTEEKSVDKEEKSDIIVLREEVKNGKITLEINKGKQKPHMLETKQEGKSYFTIGYDELQSLVNQKYSTGTIYISNKGQIKETVECDKAIGFDVDFDTQKESSTNRFTIHYSKSRTHCVPSKRK